MKTTYVVEMFSTCRWRGNPSRFQTSRLLDEGSRLLPLYSYSTLACAETVVLWYAKLCSFCLLSEDLYASWSQSSPLISDPSNFSAYRRSTRFCQRRSSFVSDGGDVPWMITRDMSPDSNVDIECRYRIKASLTVSTAVIGYDLPFCKWFRLSSALLLPTRSLKLIISLHQ